VFVEELSQEYAQCIPVSCIFLNVVNACSGNFEHVASVDTRKDASSTLASSMLYIGYQIGYAASGFTIIAVRRRATRTQLVSSSTVLHLSWHGILCCQVSGRCRTWKRTVTVT
jgi:hypothetical protein